MRNSRTSGPQRRRSRCDQVPMSTSSPVRNHQTVPAQVPTCYRVLRTYIHVPSLSAILTPYSLLHPRRLRTTPTNASTQPMSTTCAAKSIHLAGRRPTTDERGGGVIQGGVPAITFQSIKDLPTSQLDHKTGAGRRRMYGGQGPDDMRCNTTPEPQADRHLCKRTKKKQTTRRSVI